MGSSDSKPEEEQIIINKKNKGKNANSPSNSQLKSRHPMDDRIDSPLLGKQNNQVVRQKQKQRMQNHYDEGDIQGIGKLQQNYIDHQELYQNQEQPTIFNHWLPQFHKQGSTQAKIMVLTLQPTPQYKKLQRNYSQHTGTLSWSYEQRKAPSGQQLLMRLIFQEEGGYYLNFLVDQSSSVIEGDQAIWDLICPFRTKQEVTKIGGFNCQRTYQSSQPPENDEPREIDPELFIKWQQKVPEQRTNMRTLLRRRRQCKIIQSNKGFEYRQVSKYFAANGEWSFSVLVEQKFNTFRCWMIESDNQKYNSMSVTLKGDVENRESMFVQQMKKKRKYFRQVEKNKKMV